MTSTTKVSFDSFTDEYNPSNGVGATASMSESTTHDSSINRPSGQRVKRRTSGASVSFRISPATDEQKALLKEENPSPVIYPWSKYYKAWWGLTVIASVITLLYDPYQIAFGQAGKSFENSSAIVEYVLVSIFVIDILVNFNLAFYNDRGEVVFDKVLIAKNYFRFWLWVDVIGVFPFFAVALACAGEIGEDSTTAQYLSLLRLFRFVRLHRMKAFFDSLQYNTRVSLMWLTLTRNFAAALVWTHFNACIMYFIARQYNFDEDLTWIGGQVNGLNGFEEYLTSLYWSVVTFTTVGYGDFSPVNSGEQIWGMIYMLLNIILNSWMIGSITLLIVKNDEKTGLYRDTLKMLDKYSTMNSFDKPFHKRLKKQIKLDFNNREIADEQVLQHFPSSVRRKILHRLYLPSLIETNLMKGVRQQFVDAFLTTCKVEIFSPGEEILQRGSITSDLYLLVGGVVKLMPWDIPEMNTKQTDGNNSIASSEMTTVNGISAKELEAGNFINPIGFFTESAQIDTVRTVTVCKTLTMSRSEYKSISDDHPGSVGKILHNLLAMAEEMEIETASAQRVSLSKRLEVLSAGTSFCDNNDDSTHTTEVYQTMAAIQTAAAVKSVQDLVKIHINKQKDDHTTRFLFAASRGDTLTISLMCDQGFNPNSADYDFRTALMVAAMKGNTDAVTTLLEHDADPNLVDMHGSSALYEAARNGHEDTMEELIKHGAELCMDESQAASALCQAVSDSDYLRLRRLLRAKIQINASDYDKRTAAHIAAAEGNTAALKVLVEFGADLTLKDRWGNTVEDEAKRANSAQFLECVQTSKNGTAAQN